MKPKPRLSSISSHCTRKQTFRILILYLSVRLSVRRWPGLKSILLCLLRLQMSRFPC